MPKDSLYLPIAGDIASLSSLIIHVAKLVAEYVGLEESVFYKTQKESYSLSRNIPPLPKDLSQIVNGKCPIYAGKPKAYKIKDTLEKGLS